MRNMVGVDFIGRLGNQMFTYAFVRALFDQQPTRQKEFVANFRRCGDGKADGWGNSLRFLNTLPCVEERADLILKYGEPAQRILYIFYKLCCKIPFVYRKGRWMHALEKLMRDKGLHFTGAADAAYCMEVNDSRVFVRGYFQDRRFFDHIRPILLKEFTPRHPPLPHNQELYDVISRPNSVCVSVRRGDYLSDAFRKDFHVCSPEYYQKAFRAICSRVHNPVFIFFSDDIQWVRAHMKAEGFPCYYERGDDPVWEKLRLMYSCHHFIISNSTFAWWAQYLGSREGKEVVSPARWYANPAWHSNLVNDDFLFVDV